MRRALKVLAMSVMCALPLGYVFFSSLLPNATYPTFVRFPLIVPILTAAGMGYLAGLALDRVDEAVFASLTSTGLGVVLMLAMVAFPSSSPFLESGNTGELILSVLNYSLVVVVASFVLFFIASFAGQYTIDEPGEKDYFEKEPEAGPKGGA